MVSITLITVGAALSAALVAVAERFGVAPLAAAHGRTAPAAAWMYGAVAQHVDTTAPAAAGRKADDRFRPRGRRL